MDKLEKARACQPTPQTDRPLLKYHTDSEYRARAAKSIDKIKQRLGELSLHLVTGQAGQDRWRQIERLLAERWEGKV